MISRIHSEVELEEVRSNASAYGLLLVYLLVIYCLRLHACVGASKRNGGQNAFVFNNTVSLSHGRVALLKNCPTRLLPYTHKAEPQMYGYYRGWLYNAGTFSSRFSSRIWQ